MPIGSCDLHGYRAIQFYFSKKCFEKQNQQRNDPTHYMQRMQSEYHVQELAAACRTAKTNVLVPQAPETKDLQHHEGDSQ